MPSKYDNMKASEIKDRLKKVGMSQVGDKGTMIYRLDIFDRCDTKKLTVEGDVNPCLLKAGDLKKCASKLGISPMLTSDEILGELVTLLEASSAKTSTTRPSSSGTSSSSVTAGQKGGEQNGSNIDGVGIAKLILELNETDDYEAILNISTTSAASRITRQTPVAVMRKAYLKLSLIIHPDKLGRSFDQATKAFQALVSAFDRLSSPEVEEEVISKGKNKVAKIARSNEGCYRTRVCCPRCKQIWSEGTLDGNPDYFYNFLMTGLKQFSCSTCLCEFGCMTALHKCPSCQGLFEYSPEDYHRKVTCGREKCASKPFGFFCYSTSDRVISEVKKEVKAEHERRLKARESKLRRAKRMEGRGSIDEERAFLFGLTECCPRCGDTFDTFPDGDQRVHLQECTDKKKHAAYRDRLLKAKEAGERKGKRADAQLDAQTVATWQFLGAKTDQLWLLNEDQLRRQASDQGMDTAGDKDDLISRIVAEKRKKGDDDDDDDEGRRGKGGKKMKMLCDSSSSSSALTKISQKGNALVVRGKSKISIDSLPSNIHGMSAPQLRSVCASNGLLHLLPKDATKSEILSIIEAECYDDGKREKVVESEDDASDASDDGDDVQVL